MLVAVAGWGVVGLFTGGGLGAVPAVAQPADSTLTLVDAVRTTVREHPRLRQQRAAIIQQEGRLTTARGAFDTRLTLEARRARDRTPLTPLQQQQYPGVSEQVTDTYSTQLSLNRTLGTGLRIQPSVALNRTALGAAGESLPAAVSSLPSNNTAEVGVTLTQPLLKGRGATATKAETDAAEASLDAAQAAWRQAVAQQVRGTVQAYWQYVAAQERLRVARASEARVERLLEETVRLVEADQRPAAELDQLRADRADKRAARIRAEEAVFAARTELGRAMGVSSRRSARLSPPADSLPALSEPLRRDSLPPAEALADYAVRHRADVAAARQRTAAAEELWSAARRNELHRLDLSVGAGYTGITGGEAVSAYVDPLAQNVGGMNFEVGLQYELPVRNREAEGAQVQRRAAYDRQQVAQDRAARRVRIDVQQARRRVTAGRAELEQTRTAVRYHRRALDNERQKRRQGVSTLFTVLLFEERLTRALRTHIAARRRLAVGMATLHYALGRFSAPAVVQAQPSLSRADFVAVPSLPPEGS